VVRKQIQRVRRVIIRAISGNRLLWRPSGDTDMRIGGGQWPWTVTYKGEEMVDTAAYRVSRGSMSFRSITRKWWSNRKYPENSPNFNSRSLSSPQLAPSLPRTPCQSHWALAESLIIRGRSVLRLLGRRLLSVLLLRGKLLELLLLRLLSVLWCRLLAVHSAVSSLRRRCLSRGRLVRGASSVSSAATISGLGLGRSILVAAVSSSAAVRRSAAIASASKVIVSAAAHSTASKATATSSIPKGLALLALDIDAVGSRHVDGLPSAVVLRHDGKLDQFALGQRLEALRLNFRIMHEHIARSVVHRDEAEALRRIELFANALAQLVLRALVHRHRTGIHHLGHRCCCVGWTTSAVWKGNWM